MEIETFGKYRELMENVPVGLITQRAHISLLYPLRESMLLSAFDPLFFSELPIYTRNIGSSAHTAVVARVIPDILFL